MAYLIDLTRLASRLGRGALTGVDRVEAAWTEHLLTLSDDLHGLVRLKWSFALLDRAGVAAILAAARSGAPLPRADTLSRLIWRGNPARAAAEGFVRRLARKRSSVPGFRRLIAVLGPPVTYLNLGHSNLTGRVIGGLRRSGAEAVVLIHDVIPLDRPEFARADIPQIFARKLAAVSAHASLVVHLTPSARAATESQLARAGRVPPGVTAPLGVTLAKVDPSGLPPDLDLSAPFVLVLGTIEPRKNHALLARVWTETPGLPRLLVVGHPGWNTEQVVATLAALPNVTLAGPLPDGAVAALMQRAQALAFPTLAEGFGLPPLEAALHGCPVYVSDLPVLRESLSLLTGADPVYLDPNSPYAWSKAMQSLGKHGERTTKQPLPKSLAGWAEHFNTVLTVRP